MPANNSDNYRDVSEIMGKIAAEKRSVSDEGRPEAVDKMHERGSLTARERIDHLCDPHSFDEYGQLVAPSNDTPEIQEMTREDAPADGVVTGIGEIGGRQVVVISFDYTVMGGSMGDNGFKKIRRLLDLAEDNGYPVVSLHDGGGHRIQEGLDARPIAHGDPQGVWEQMVRLSGWVPQVAGIMGPGFAGPTNFAAMTDFVGIVEGTGTMGIAGPPIVKAALGVEISKEDYGAEFHTNETGIAHAAYEDDEDCLDGLRRYLSYLPQNAREHPPSTDDITPPTEEDRERLRTVVPSNPKKAYEVHHVIEGIIDRESFFEIQPDWARNIVTGFGQIRGAPVGIVANNPRFKAGTLENDASHKAPHFISVCDAFSVPIVFLADIPGFLPGPEQEKGGIGRHAAKFVYELGRATTPVIHVLMRRGYGLGYITMAGGRERNQLNLAWPTAELAGMSVEGAVELVFADEIEQADDPEARRAEIVAEYTERTGPLRAAEDMGIDVVVGPDETREWIARTLERVDDEAAMDRPSKKHGIHPF